jgi:CBS domain-containing protein
MMRVDQIMTPRAFVCRPDDDASVAAGLMWDHDCGAVGVVDDAGRLVGIVTDRDICMAAYTRGRALHEMPVRSIMQSNVRVCLASDDVCAVEALMTEHHVRRVPVVDQGGRPIGIVSLVDLARSATRVGPAMPERVRGIVRTFVGICDRTGSTAAHMASSRRAA